jgi:hypothetical protein
MPILGEEVYHMYGLRYTCRFYTNSRGGGISHAWFEGDMQVLYQFKGRRYITCMD